MFQKVVIINVWISNTTFSRLVLLFIVLCNSLYQVLEKKPALMFRTCKEIRGCARMNEFFPLSKDCAFEVYNYFPFSLFLRKTDARCQNVS